MNIGVLITNFFTALEAYDENMGQAEYDAVLAAFDALQAAHPSPQWNSLLPPAPGSEDAVVPSGQDPVGNPE